MIYGCICSSCLPFGSYPWVNVVMWERMWESECMHFFHDLVHADMLPFSCNRRKSFTLKKASKVTSRIPFRWKSLSSSSKWWIIDVNFNVWGYVNRLEREIIFFIGLRKTSVPSLNRLLSIWRCQLFCNILARQNRSCVEVSCINVDQTYTSFHNHLKWQTLLVQIQ